MKVHVSFGGRFLALYWTSSETQARLSLVKPFQLDLVARRVFEEYADARVLSLHPIEIVAPSPLINAAAERQKVRVEEDQFYSQLLWQVSRLVKKGHALPPLLEVCNSYNSGSEDGSKDYLEDSDENHHGCLNCAYRIKLVGMTKHELYTQFHDKWVSLGLGDPPSKDPPWLKDSLATPAIDLEPLWYAYHGGHGLGLFEVDYREIEEADKDDYYSLSVLSGQVLFFFRQFVHLPVLVERLERLRACIESNRKKDQEAEDKRYEEEQREREKKETEGILELFIST